MTKIIKSKVSNYTTNSLIDELLFAKILQEERNVGEKQVLDLLSGYPSKSRPDKSQIANAETMIWNSKTLTNLWKFEQNNEKLLQILVEGILKKHRFPKHLLKAHAISPEVNIIKKKPHDVWIPLYEIHCPPKKGSTATLSEIQCSGRSGGLKINILGTGGKFNSSFKDCISSAVNADHEGCIIKKRKMIIVPYTFEIKCRLCKFTTGKKNEVTCIPTEDTLQDFISKIHDPCRTVKLLKSLRKGGTKIIKQKDTDEAITSTKEKIMEFSIGITSPFTFNITGSVSSAQTMTYSYHLKSPWAYTPYSKGKIPRGWKVTPP